MKQSINIILIFFLIFLLSCNNSQSNRKDKIANDTIILIVEDLEDLYIKYDSLKINNCEQLIEMANDISVAYFNTIDNASLGNEKAKSDFLDFNLFKSKFDLIKENLGKDCQPELLKWETDFSGKQKLFDKKIEAILNQDTLKYNYKVIEDSIYNNLDKQLEELKTDLSTHLNEEKKE